ncbi:SDR family oxidoreductase [Psychromicrobium sp. YIM B11713]|uniref:SDR family oxidoreductase n=1 Tax=Psychromicrobium sp. YIM B11713 TaxID=3145233 RepID=UPI00374EC6C4
MSTSYENEVIVISGASTGLGAATARLLAEQGFHVLAGVRREQDAERLRRPGLEPILLDVTEPSQIAQLVERMNTLGKPLRAVINNAGFAANAPVETMPLETWRKVFDVNVFGLIALTQALLPSLHRSKGRVVNISSVGGRVALPAFGAYSGSKFAVEGISDALRQELAPHGVQVVVVEPGGMRTDMAVRGEEMAHSLLERMTPEQRSRYNDTMQTFLSYTASMEQAGVSSEQAAKTVLRAVTAERSRPRYTIGRDAAVMSRLIRFLPDRLLDRMIASTLRRSSKAER